MWEGQKKNWKQNCTSFDVCLLSSVKTSGRILQICREPEFYQRETKIVIKQEVHVLFVLQKQYRIKVMKSQNEYLYKVAAFSKIWTKY